MLRKVDKSSLKPEYSTVKTAQQPQKVNPLTLPG